MIKGSLVKSWLNTFGGGEFVATKVEVIEDTTWITTNVLVDVVTKNNDQFHVVVDPLQWENSKNVASLAFLEIKKAIALIDGISVCATCDGLSDYENTSRYLEHSDGVVFFYGWRPSHAGELCQICGENIGLTVANVYM